MSPPGFDTPVTGPAYGRAFRALSTAMLLAVLALAARVVWQSAPADGEASGHWVLGAGVLALAASYWVLVRSQTTIDATGIRQSGLIERKVAWVEVYSAHLFGPPFARRLVIRTANGRFRFFFGGSPELLEAFARITQAYRR